MSAYLDDYRLWLSALVVIVVFKVIGFFLDHFLKCIIDDIKYDAVEEYKKNEGKNDATD